MSDVLTFGGRALASSVPLVPKLCVRKRKGGLRFKASTYYAVDQALRPRYRDNRRASQLYTLCRNQLKKQVVSDIFNFYIMSGEILFL